MVDNLKSAVLKRAVGEAPVFNPKYLDFATHYGFTIAPCNVGKGNEKGRVENGVGYVKKNFLAGLEFPDFSALNPAARQWLDTVANVRLHGETREQPTSYGTPSGRRSARCRCIRSISPPCPRSAPPGNFALPSRPTAIPSPPTTPARRSRSKPIPIGSASTTGTSSLPAMPDATTGFQDVEDPDHPKPLLEQRKKARDHQLFRRFLALSPRAEAYYLKLEERRLNPHHHVRKIVALSDIYTPEAVARAMEDAFVYEAFSSDYIANLLEQRARFTPEASALHLTRREDLLEVSLAPPDLSLYQATPQTKPHDT